MPRRRSRPIARSFARIDRHRALLATLGRLDDGEEPPWDEMLTAAETLEEIEIEAERGPPALH